MPEIQPFKLERYFAHYEFNVKYLLSPSDCESLSQKDLLALADAESLARWENLSLGYTESSGLPALRQQIVQQYPGLTADQALVAAPEEAIFIAMQVLLRQGDHVIVLSPAYQSLYEIARSIGCEVTPWYVQPEKGRWLLDLEYLKQATRPQTRLLVVNFPHNPTGFLPTLPEFQEIINLARQNNLILFCDEMYRSLEYHPEDRLPPACILYEKAISLSGVSKTLSLPGLRIGWLATQDQELMHRFQHYKDYTTICSSAPSEVLALIGLRAQEQILQRNLGIIQSNLQFAHAFFTENERLFEWYPPRAGSVAFPGWKGKENLERFCQQMLDQQGIMIVPGNMFEYPGAHFRVGLGRINFPEALEKIRTEIKSV